MKKTALLAVLVLFVVSAMVSGSLAIYNAVVDVGEGEMEAAMFIVRAEKEGQAFSSVVNIAPGDTYAVNFTVFNYENSDVTETDMRLVINAELKGEVQPIEMVLSDAEGELARRTGPGFIDYDTEKAVFKANIPDTRVYTLTFIWPEGEPGADNEYINKPVSFYIKLNGIQIEGTSAKSDATDIPDSKDEQSEQENIEDLTRQLKEILKAVQEAAALDDPEAQKVLGVNDGCEIVDSTATELAGTRHSYVDMMLEKNGVSIDNAWTIRRIVKNKTINYEIFITDKVSADNLSINHWTTALHLCSDGVTVERGYIKTISKKDTAGVIYKGNDFKTFRLSIDGVKDGKDLISDKLYP